MAGNIPSADAEEWRVFFKAGEVVYEAWAAGSVHTEWTKLTASERVAWSRLARIVDKIEVIVPYVTATLGPGNIVQAKENPDWFEVHGGRLESSRSQLTHLLKLAQEMK